VIPAREECTLLENDGRTRLAASLIALVLAVGILVLISSNKIGFYVVPTSSMEPTLHPEDRIVAIAASKFHRGQVVVLHDPERANEFLVKRIVGFPGDLIAVYNGKLMVNDTPVTEPYLREPMDYQLPPTRVAAGEVFILGDNRNESDDSHLWKKGVPTADIVGAVRYIYSPKDRRGKRVSYPETFQGVAGPAATAQAATP